MSRVPFGGRWKSNMSGLAFWSLNRAKLSEDSNSPKSLEYVTKKIVFSNCCVLRLPAAVHYFMFNIRAVEFCTMYSFMSIHDLSLSLPCAEAVNLNMQSRPESFT